MSGGNIFCPCGQQAHVFGLVGTAKESRCQGHAGELIAKKVTIYDVEAFYFIDTPGDSGLYETRKAEVTAANGLLDVVEACFDAELRQHEKDLTQAQAIATATVESIFADAQTQLRSRHQELTAQLQYIRSSLEAYRTNKAKDLTDSEKRICAQTATPPRCIRLVIADPAASIRTVLRWRLAGHSAGDILDVERRPDIGRKEVESAQATLQTGPAEFVSESIAFLESCGLSKEAAELKAQTTKQHPNPGESQRLAAMRTFQRALKAKGEFRYSHAVDDLEEAWRILQATGDESKDRIDVGEALGELLCLHRGQFPRAEAVFREALAFQTAIDFSATEALRLCNWISACYLYSGRYREAETSCKWTAETFAFASYSAESYLMMVYYWERAVRKMGRGGEAVQLIRESEGKSFPGDNAMSQAIRLLLAADALSEQNSFAEAEVRYLESLSLTSLHCPASPLHTWVLASLGNTQHKLRKPDFGEQYLLRALSLNQFHYPHGLDTARNLVDLANVCSSQKKIDDAITRRKQAEEIYYKHYPMALETANNLNNMGNLYMKIGRWSEAETKELAALDVYQQYFADSPDLARSLSSLGILYSNMKRWGDAEQMYQRAATIFSRYPGMLDSARNLNNLGAFYTSQSRYFEAEQKYLEAMNLYAVYHPKCPDAVGNLTNLSTLYQRLGRSDECQRIRALADSSKANS